MKNILFIALLPLATLVMAAPVRDQHVTAELIPEVTAVQPGQSFWVALKLVHDEHWHTYWINDGDSGLPTKIRWELPDGFSAGSIVWPYPKRIEMPPLVSYGYEGERVLLVEVTPPPVLERTNVTLTARVSWLMCKEICIPGKATLSLDLPVGTASKASADAAALFAEARRNIPSRETGWKFAARVNAPMINVLATPPPGAAPLGDLEFFPLEKGLLSNSAKAIWRREGDAYRIDVTLENSVDQLPASLSAVLVTSPSMARDPNRPAVEISLPLNAESATPPAEGLSPPTATAGRGLATISFFAFLGGIILNLMPCVFPVISLKILGFVKQAGEDPRAVWRHGLVFAAGVLVSFWILAGVLMALRSGGAGIGWGFQLQSPEVLVVLSLLFFVLALNLFGVFEMGLSLTSAGGSVTRQEGWTGSFFSGVLATVIATPCTAPFMGVALGYALTQPPHVAMTVFSALALGMAFPYLLLSRYPALLKKLPRPGPWMETMKQVMGFLLMATVVWLCWVLSALAGADTLAWLLAAFLFAGFGAWILGKWDTLSRTPPVRWVSRMAGLGLMAIALAAGLGNITKTGGESTAAGADGEWKAYTPEVLADVRASGRPVFIDFTAKWCLTCQVNKLTVLRTSEVMEEFRRRGVALLYADWTDENEIIARELARHGRQSVPLYLLYSGGAEREPVVLPEILTRKIVLDALKNLE